MARLRAKLKRGYVSIIVIAVAAVLLSITMLAPVVSTTTDFSIFNTGWNGTSGLAVSTYKIGKFVPSFQFRSTGTDMEVVQVPLDQIDLDPVGASLVVIGPSMAFTEAEGTLVADFVRGGGKLLLADDFGTGNTLLEAMGASSRISGKLVMDLAFNKKPEFSVCFDLRQDPLTRNVTTLLLNYPSSITINGTATKAIAYTSVASWLDQNNDQMQEFGEERGPFPVIAREAFGAGSILLFSDPSVLINGMRGYLNNTELVDNIVAEICTGRTAVYFDESHRDYFDPVAITMDFTGQVSSTAKAAMVLLLFIVVLWLATDYVDRAVAVALRQILVFVSWFNRTVLRRRHEERTVERLSLEELERRITELHPEWRPGLVRYILKESGRHAKASADIVSGKSPRSE